MAITNSLPAYVDQNKDTLIKKSVLGSKSAKLFTLQTGVKTKSAINLLNTTVTLQSGSACGWNEAGSSTLTQRTIEAPVLKINQSFCDKTLLNSVLQYDVRVAAGQKTLPFEQDFVDGVLSDLASKTEVLIWKGNKTGTTSTYLDLSNGLIQILTADVPGGNVVGTGTTITSVNVIGQVNAVYAAIPAAILDKAVIFVGNDTYRTYVMALQAANLYHIDPKTDGFDMYFPGSSVKIVAVPGLDGTNWIVAANPEHIFYGTDLSGDDEKFDFWYSIDNQEFRLAIQFTLGVQVAFPDQIIIRKG